MSWTYQFVREWIPTLDLPSVVRLRRYVLHESSNHASSELVVQLRGWGPVHLRTLGGGDFRMFDDMFRRRMIPPVIPGCQTLIDLGGNIGLATIALARALPGLRSYVVEPDAGNVAMLERNLAPLVAQGRCTIERGAMWKTDDVIEIEPPELEGSFGAVRCVDGGGGGEVVQGMTMKTILDRSGFERVDLVKVDVEGAEAGLFDSGQDWLDRVDALAVEFHGSARQQSDFDRVVAECGFSVEETYNNGVVATRRTARARAASA
ncbi:MAG: FkbM family methyltransferase [Bryobacterales bacterium]